MRSWPRGLNLKLESLKNKTVSEPDQAYYYSRWYIAAIHVALSMPNLQTVPELKSVFSPWGKSYSRSPWFPAGHWSCQIRKTKIYNWSKSHSYPEGLEIRPNSCIQTGVLNLSNHWIENVMPIFTIQQSIQYLNRMWPNCDCKWLSWLNRTWKSWGPQRRSSYAYTTDFFELKS